jgi:hypothetical protein
VHITRVYVLEGSFRGRGTCYVLNFCSICYFVHHYELWLEGGVILSSLNENYSPNLCLTAFVCMFDRFWKILDFCYRTNSSIVFANSCHSATGTWIIMTLYVPLKLDDLGLLLRTRDLQITTSMKYVATRPECRVRSWR